MPHRCEVPMCRNEADIVYLGCGICTDCWNRPTVNDAQPDCLRMVLGIEAAHEPEVENTMSKSKKKQTEQPSTETPQADVAAAPEKKAKPTKAEKAAKTPKKRERKPKEEDLVVFAFRLSQAERDAIHKAAGPARASRFVRTIAVAAAAEDEAAIRSVIKDAREARA